MSELYKGIEGNKLLHPKSVIKLEDINAIAFHCPCGERIAYVSSPPHKITFDENKILTIKNSCGYKATKDKPTNWCHFYIKDGQYKMVDDSQCPGRKLL